jgi:hypothetical protein
MIHIPPMPTRPPATPAAPVDRPVGGARLPDWRTGQHVDLTPPPAEDTENDATEAEPEEALEEGTPEKDEADDAGDDADGEPDPDEQPDTGRIYQRPKFTAPSALRPKQSVADWARGIWGSYSWPIYNGTALGTGFALRMPQFFRDETAYLTVVHHSWTAAPTVAWYGVAAVILLADWRSRGWWPGLAWAMRIPTASLVVGTLLYGNPIPA